MGGMKEKALDILKQIGVVIAGNLFIVIYSIPVIIVYFLHHYGIINGWATVFLGFIAALVSLGLFGYFSNH